MSRAERIVAAALALVGARFRLNGRDPAHGLDCIGVALLALQAGGVEAEVPPRQRLGGPGLAQAERLAAAAGLERVGEVSPGDLLLGELVPGRLHCAVAVPGGRVEAHALLRRVVLTPGGAPAELSAWRAG